MSSVLPERRLLQPHTPFLRIARRRLVTGALVCVALFAFSFLIGRMLSPPRGQNGAVPAFAATQASAAIPVRLSAAPAIGLARPVAVTVHATTHARATPAVASAKAATPTAASAVPVLTQQATPPATVQPVTAQAPVAVTPAPAKAPAPAPKPAPATTPASSRPSGGAAAPKHGGGVSFDSSG